MKKTNCNQKKILIDQFNRIINYVRISVTDRCDFRCVYCMAEKMEFVPRNRLLRLEEIARIGKIFTELGVKKIRITGGEPLVRRNIIQLFEYLGKLPKLNELVLTTNGSQLTKLAKPLKKAGVKRINISLDSLEPEKFRRLTRNGELNNVLDGIDSAINVGFERLKINSVILKNRNDDEISDLVNFAIDHQMDISFIEEMPLGIIEDHNRFEAYYSSSQIKNDLEKVFKLIPSTETTGGPSKYFKISETNTRVGFISPHSNNFCAQCNRIRLTCEGRLLLCLGKENSIDLRAILRNSNDDEKVKETILNAMLLKPEKHDFDLNGEPVIFRHMNVTGG